MKIGSHRVLVLLQSKHLIKSLMFVSDENWKVIVLLVGCINGL